jgi:lysozyme family protein
MTKKVCCSPLVALVTRLTTSIAPHVYVVEGWDVNLPDDPGGATIIGMTRRTYKILFGEDDRIWNLLHTHAPNCRGRNWDALPSEVKKSVIDMYVRYYLMSIPKDLWQVLKDDEHLACLVLDIYTNLSPQSAGKVIQRCVNRCSHRQLVVDGVVGSKTQKAFSALVKDTEQVDVMINMFIAWQIHYCNQAPLRAGRNLQFMAGWIRRTHHAMTAYLEVQSEF